MSKDAFRPIAAMVGMMTTTDQEWERTYTEFCGDYQFYPCKGIEVEWLRRWINTRGSEGYIPGSKLHNFLFGVKPKPSWLAPVEFFFVYATCSTADHGPVSYTPIAAEARPISPLPERDW